jgi:hypothetical protein
MKHLLTFVTLGGLLTAATAHAQIDFYLTGSTAFRANTYRSIRAMYGNQGGALTGQNPADGGGNASGSNIVTFAGTMPTSFGSQVVTIHCSYSGSAAGIQALAQNTFGTFYGSATAGDGTTSSHTSDLALSDVFQSSTAYQKPALIDSTVGVQPFTYTKSVTTPVSVTNITIQQLQALESGGVMPLSYFTGNNADDANLLYLVGRDPSSGTRITSILDSLFIGSPLLWAPDAQCRWNVSSGFSSGGNIVTVLNGTCGAAIGYLGVADAKNVNAGANILAYDGVKPFYGLITAPDWTPVTKGLYSFWSYEHLFIRSTASANVSTFRNLLKNEINTDLATSTTAIQVGAMKVSRSADGGPISP